MTSASELIALAEELERTTKAMAGECSVGMGLWNIHSNACLNAAKALRLASSSPEVMREECKRAVTELDCMYVNDERVPYGGIPADPESSVWREAIKAAEAAIDNLPPIKPDSTSEPKSQEPDAVAWQYQRADGKWCDCWKPNEIELKVAAKRFRPLYTHPTTKPEARPDAVAVKPLEWKVCASDGSSHKADTILGRYVTWEIGNGHWCPPGANHGQGVDGDWAAAKAAAQADYEQRIRSAIEPTTKPEAQAVGVDVIEAGQFDCREFCEDAFRSMEVQICGDTRTVQFGVSDHGGDHPTMPCCAISWTDAADLASWIQSCIAPVSVDAESIHQLIYKDTHNALEGLVPDTFLSGELWIATQAGGR